MFTSLLIAALLANAAIAGAQLAFAGMTGSSALLADGVRALLTASHATLMLIYCRTQARYPDRPQREDPSRRTTDVGFWSFVVGGLLMGIGAGVTVHEGARRLAEAALPATREAIPLVIAGSLVLSLALALAARRASLGVDTRGRQTSLLDVAVPRAIAAEAWAGFISALLVIASLVSARTDPRAWADPAAALAIGLVLAATGVILAMQSRRLEHPFADDAFASGTYPSAGAASLPATPDAIEGASLPSREDMGVAPAASHTQTTPSAEAQMRATNSPSGRHNFPSHKSKKRRKGRHR